MGHILQGDPQVPANVGPGGFPGVFYVHIPAQAGKIPEPPDLIGGRFIVTELQFDSKPVVSLGGIEAQYVRYPTSKPHALELGPGPTWPGFPAGIVYTEPQGWVPIL